MRVVVAGSTGLVGRAMIDALLATSAVEAVTALVRREWRDAPAHPKLSVASFDFDRPESGASLLRGDALVCALGTTMKQAGSEAAFRRVDHDYPVALGEVAHAAGTHHYLLVSAVGADPASRVFYNRVKGETEADIRKLNFPCITLARPSLLLGARAEFRLGEVLGRVAGILAPPRWRPVHATQVAASLVEALLRHAPGVEVLENRRLRAAPSADYKPEPA
jgi:uncharacterized protein YbjT (DUF2867 family)